MLATINCFFNGHQFKKMRETFIDDPKEGFYSSNYGTSVTQYGYDVFICEKCLKQKKVVNGKKQVR